MSLLGAVPDRTARPRADPSWDVQALFLLPGKEPELLVTLRGAQASSHPLVHGACSWRWSWGRESVWICWPGGGFSSCAWQRRLRPHGALLTADVAARGVLALPVMGEAERRKRCVWKHQAVLAQCHVPTPKDGKGKIPCALLLLP